MLPAESKLDRALKELEGAKKIATQKHKRVTCPAEKEAYKVLLQYLDKHIDDVEETLIQFQSMTEE